jgi:predicted RNA binding protein YcfA (HicA-like mRNA interferase family)
MYRAADRRVLTVPMHFRKTVPKGTLHAIIKQAGFTTQQFAQLLED